MKIRGPVRLRNTDVDMVPMINIVFLLLVFVILSGGAVRVPVPAAADTAADVLVVDRYGGLRLNGTPLARAELSRRLQPLQGPLQIDADSALAARALIELLHELHAAGVGDARLRSVSPPGVPA